MNTTRVSIWVATLACAGYVLAASEAQESACLNPRSSPDERIASCTGVIDDTGEAEGVRFTAYVNRARAFFAKQDWDRSIADYDSAIPLIQNSASIYNERGAAHDRKGDRERAVADYSAAIRIDPAYSLAYANRGLAHLKNDAHDLALADFDTAIRLNPRYAIAYNGRGVVWSKMGEFKRAIGDFSEAIRLEGAYANAFNNRGIAQANIGRFDPAIVDLRAAVRLDAGNAEFQNELAWTYLRAGKPAAGLPHVERALGINPSLADAYDTRGLIYEALGERSRAVRDLEKALSLKPSLASSSAALARLQRSDAGPSSVSDIIQFVEERGWFADLGDVCREFALEDQSRKCIFKQISVQETSGRSDPYGFNVRTDAKNGSPYVLLFHLSPLIGEFFIASPQGELIRAYYRAKGTGYRRVPNSDVAAEFERDLSYWRSNLARLRRGVEMVGPRQ